MRKTEITETPLSWGFSKAAASCRTDFCVDHTEAGGDVLWLLAGTEVLFHFVFQVSQPGEERAAALC